MSVTREYCCSGKCRKNFNYEHKSMSEESLKECPTCKGRAERILQPSQFTIYGDNASNSYGLRELPLERQNKG